MLSLVTASDEESGGEHRRERAEQGSDGPESGWHDNLPGVSEILRIALTRQQFIQARLYPHLSEAARTYPLPRAKRTMGVFLRLRRTERQVSVDPDSSRECRGLSL